MTATREADTAYRVLLRRALAAGNTALLHVHFDAGVLERYRDGAGFSLIRTNTVGRLKKEGDWSLDFGIAPGEKLLHLPAGDLLRLPEQERQHWSEFVVLLPSSSKFLQMRLAPGSCFDDGETRPW